MDKEFLQKIKRFILKIIYCPQKIFFAGGTFYLNARPTNAKNNMVAFRGKKILKIEIFKHKRKKNSLKEEANILKFLTKIGNLSQPKFFQEGFLFTGKKYMITERVFEKGEASLPDILLAVLEQQKTGVFHHDVKDDNVIFDGTLARLIDYDQSDYREEMKTLLPKDSIEYFIDKQTSNWVDDCNIPAFGKNFYEALKNSLSYFDGENFDFEQTTLYEKLSKNSKGGFPYYEISEPGIFARGEKNIADIRQVLDKISFSIGERVLDFGCNTGTLSFYLESRGCDVYSFDSDKNAMICTKILSNIINRKCTVLNLDLKRNCFPKDYDTVLLLNDDFYSKFKIEKIRNAKKRTQRFIAKVYDLERTKKLRGYEVTKTFPVEGEDFFIVVLEKVRKPKAQV